MIKICPMCGHNNSVDSIFCEECDNDLSRVSVSAQIQPTVNGKRADISDRAPAVADTKGLSTFPDKRIPEPVTRTGRRCKCGEISPLNVMICQNCGESLATAPIVRKENASSPSSQASGGSWVLISNDNEATLNIIEGQHLLIGWEGELGGYLNRTQKVFVSRKHGTLSVVRGELFFEDNGSTNGTLINDRPIAKGKAQKLSVGDILCLGGLPGIWKEQAAYFRIERR